MLHEPDHHSPLTIPELVSSGDWACAHHERAMLADVANLLGLGLSQRLRDECTEIEQLASCDLPAAERRWSDVARSLRDWLAASYVHR